MKKNGSRVGQYVIVDPRYSREESERVGGSAMRYYGSDGEWHRTFGETPSWKTREEAVRTAGVGVVVARIVAKKKVEPKKLNLLECITDWDLMVELGRRFSVDPDDIDAAIDFIRTVK